MEKTIFQNIRISYGRHNVNRCTILHTTSPLNASACVWVEQQTQQKQKPKNKTKKERVKRKEKFDWLKTVVEIIHSSRNHSIKESWSSFAFEIAQCVAAVIICDRSRNHIIFTFFALCFRFHQRSKCASAHFDRVYKQIAGFNMVPRRQQRMKYRCTNRRLFLLFYYFGCCCCFFRLIFFFSAITRITIQNGMK